MAKVKGKKKSSPKNKKGAKIKKKIFRSKTERSYRKVVIVFSVVTLMLIFIITYFSFSKTVITVYPQEESIKTSASISIKQTIDETDKTSITLTGRLLSREISDSLEYKDLEMTKKIEAKAQGKVVIYNKWTQVQPLQATTRLLSTEGVLFRTKARVDVPPGDQVEAEVEADLEGAQGDIGPSRFILPGLWEGLRDKIYAESTESMTGGIKEITYVTQDDLDQAKTELSDKIAKQSKLDLASELDTKKGERISDQALMKEIIAEEYDQEVDAEAEVINATQTLKVTAVIFSESELLALMANKLVSEVPSDKELLSYNAKNLSYTVSQASLADQIALLKVNLTGTATVKSNSTIFNPSNITNKNREEITNYFSNFKEIEKVEVKFSPFWVFRAPALKDHIEFKIVK